MRKIIAACAVLVLAVGMVGCGQGSAEPNSENNAEPEAIEQNADIHEDLSLGATVVKAELTLHYPAGWEMKAGDDGSVNIKPSCGGSVLIISPTELQTSIPEFMEESDVDMLFDSYFSSMTKGGSMVITGEGKRTFENGVMESTVPITATIDDSNADGYCYVAGKGRTLYTVIAAIPHDSDQKYHQAIKEIAEAIEV